MHQKMIKMKNYLHAFSSKNCISFKITCTTCIYSMVGNFKLQYFMFSPKFPALKANICGYKITNGTLI